MLFEHFLSLTFASGIHVYSYYNIIILLLCRNQKDCCAQQWRIQDGTFGANAPSLQEIHHHPPDHIRVATSQELLKNGTPCLLTSLKHLIQIRSHHFYNHITTLVPACN